jgi:lipopolysaccharide export system protein LptA
MLFSYTKTMFAHVIYTHLTKARLLLGLLFVVMVSLSQNLYAQTQTTQGGKPIQIQHADLWERNAKGGTTADKLRGAVVLVQDPTTLTCDSALFYSSTNFAKALGHVNVQQNGVNITGEQGDYFGGTRLVDMVGKTVVLRDENSTITTTKMNYGLNSKVAFYKNGATIENKNSKLTSKRGYYHSETFDAYFKGDVRVEDPKYTLQTDTLHANNKTKIVYIVAPTTINANKGAEKIYAERGFFNSQKNYAEFWQNAKLQQEGRNGWGDKIRYDGNTKKLYLEGNAHFDDANQNVNADTIIYDETTGSAQTRGKSKIKNGTQLINAGNTSYDKITGATLLSGGVKMVDTVKNQTLIAQTVRINKKTKQNIAEGNVAFADEKQGVTLTGNHLIYNDSTGYLQATQKAMLITKMDDDSLFLAADTIKSLKIVKISEKKAENAKNDTIRTIFAYRHVRFYKKNMQGVSDSLAYTSADSTFKFYGKPIIWVDSTQLVADTTHIHLKQNKIDFVDLFTNAFVINTPDFKFYNQVKGRKIHAVFKESKLKNMFVEGNAESLYYLLDEKKAYIGLNKALAASMNVVVNENKVDKIYFYTQPTAEFVPMKKADHKAMQIAGWKWQFDMRPRGRWDLQPRPDTPKEGSQK